MLTWWSIYSRFTKFQAGLIEEKDKSSRVHSSSSSHRRSCLKSVWNYDSIETVVLNSVKTHLIFGDPDILQEARNCFVLLCCQGQKSLPLTWRESLLSRSKTSMNLALWSRIPRVSAKDGKSLHRSMRAVKQPSQLYTNFAGVFDDERSHSVYLGERTESQDHLCKAFATSLCSLKQRHAHTYCGTHGESIPWGNVWTCEWQARKRFTMPMCQA